MRNRTGIFFILAFAAAALWSASAAAAPVSVSVSFFHDQLAPHGRWVAAGSYGNCWVPSGVAAGWEPYVDGQWVYSDYGWTWASNDPWGDIPYHYGTWAYVDPYGWVWVPGTVWAPAWVTWAYTDDYVGWAPVPPTFALSATGYFGSPVVVTATHYVFVPTRQFVGVPVATVRVPVHQSVTILPHAVKTTRFEVSHGVVRVAGPPEARVARVVGHPIPRVATATLRAQPTTLSAAGLTATKGTVRVVAPKAERAKIAPAQASAQTRNEKSQAQARTAEKPPAHSARPAESHARKEAAAAHEPAPKPKSRPESEPRQANVSHTQPAPKPKSHPKPEHRAEPARPQQEAHPAPKAAPPRNAEPETRPQNETRQANAEHAQPAPKPKPRAQSHPQHPQPPKEKERPSGENR